MTVTHAELAAAVESIEAVIIAWEKNNTRDGRYIAFRGIEGGAKAITQEIASAWLQLYENNLREDFEPAAWPAVMAIDEFYEELQRYRQDCRINPDNTHPGGDGKLWQAWKNCLSALKEQRRRRPLPEPISILRAQGVGLDQIARIYEWTTGNHGDTQKVIEEIEAPGTHYNPETWVSRVDQRHEQQLKERWESRCSRVRQLKTHREDRRTRKREPDPTPLEDLILQGVGSEQIARMKMIDVDEVKATALQMGYPIDMPTPVEMPVTPAQAHDQRIAKEKAIAAEVARVAAEQKEINAGPDPYPVKSDPAAPPAESDPTEGVDETTFDELPTEERIEQLVYEGVTNTRIWEIVKDSGVKRDDFRAIARKARETMRGTAEA